MAVKTQKQKIGQIGEDLAVKFLVKHGFDIVSRNYRKKFGEIDVISSKNMRIHFVEVKTVSREILCSAIDEHRPEDNVHSAKLERIGRTIQAYIFEHDLKNDWQFDVITVELDKKHKTAKVHLITDLILQS